MKRARFFIIIFLISVAIGLFLSYVSKGRKEKYIATNFTGNTAEVGIRNERIIETSSTEEKINYKTKINLKIKYEDCKHIETKEFEVTDDFLNLTKEEFKEKFPEFEIEDFSNEEVDLQEIKQGICGNHFKITIDEKNNIIVYKLTSEYDTVLFKKTKISAEYLGDEDKKNLEEGIYVYQEQEVNSVLENFE